LINIKNIIVGDIYLIDLNVDIAGHEQKGVRPAIVVAKHDETKMCVVIPLTTQENVTRFPYTELIKKSNRNGLKQDSYALIFQIRAIDCNRIKDHLGTVDDIDFMKILTQLSKYLHISSLNLK